MGYWYDELWTIDAVLGNLTRMRQILAADVHPPLYHLILWMWIRLFGVGEVATRALSCFALAGAVPLVYALGRRLGLGRWAAAGTAGAVGMCHASAVFALETRPYTFLLLSSTAAALTVVRARTRADLLLAWAAGLAATAIHYAALFYLLPLAVLFAVCDRDLRKGWLVPAWLFALLPFTFYVKSQAKLFATYTWLFPPKWFDVAAYFEYALGFTHALAVYALFSAAALAVAANRRELPARLWLLMAPFVLCSVTAVSYLAQPIFHIRYVYTLQPWLFFVAAYLLDQLPQTSLRAAAAAALVVFVAAHTADLGVFKTEDWRLAVAYAKEHRRDEAVVTTAGAKWFRVYVPDIEILDENDVDAARAWVRRRAGQHVWMLQARDYAKTPVRQLLADTSDIEDLQEFTGSRALLLRIR